MPIADTSRTQIRRIVESVFGEVPGSGTPVDLRFTGESFTFDVKKEESKELRSDRQIGYVVPVSAGASGGFNFHLSYAAFDLELSSVMQQAWSVYGTNGVGSTFTADFATNTITASVAPTGNNAFTNLQRGQWFRLLAPTSANNGRLLRVSLSTAPTSTVITVDASTPLATGTGVANCAVQTSRLTNGVTQTSISYEKEIPATADFFIYRGMTPGKLNITFSAAALTDGSFEFMGKNGQRGDATYMPGASNPAPAYEIQNAATGVSQVWEGTAPLTSTFIKSLALSVDNVQRAQEAIGNYGYVGIGSGTLKVTGTMEVYFANGDLYDKFVANTYTAVVVATQDPDGNGYVVTLPRVNLVSGKVVAGAKDQDLMASFEIQALADDQNAVAALRKAIFIDRVGVAVA